jgi:hypothetical protein
VRSGCERFQAALAELVDRDAPPPEGVRVHLASCLRCQAELARYRRLLRLLGQLQALRPTPPEGVVAEVLSALAGEVERHALRSLVRGRRVAATVAVVAAVGVALGLAALAAALALARGRTGDREAGPAPSGRHLAVPGPSGRPVAVLSERAPA